ncbi:MAG: ribosome maturation factor RimM [Burkholderiales bacterium]|jgi:16S rRNA processing protein RimM|nr:ribosome maturation factor RimM [Burkholderiales bacterium]
MKNDIVQDSKMISIGKITGVFGIQGWVKIKTGSDADSLGHYKKLQLSLNNTNSELKIAKSQVKNGMWFVLFEGVNDRNKAENLVGGVVSVNRDEFPKADADEYYWVDLIGLKVINLQHELLGIVDNLMDTGANSVIVVKDQKNTRLIPFVAAYITDVDMQNKQIIVDWGLDY